LAFPWGNRKHGFVKKGQRDRAAFIVEWCSQGPNRRSVAPRSAVGRHIKIVRALLGGGLRQQLERGAVHLPLIDKGGAAQAAAIMTS
jgi:hypothetical protein